MYKLEYELLDAFLTEECGFSSVASKCIISEKRYQDNKLNDNEKRVKYTDLESMVFIENYLNEAIAILSINRDMKGKIQAGHIMRKIAFESLSYLEEQPKFSEILLNLKKSLEDDNVFMSPNSLTELAGCLKHIVNISFKKKVSDYYDDDTNIDYQHASILFFVLSIFDKLDFHPSREN